MPSAARAIAPIPAPEAPRDTTLLELVRILGEITDDDREIVAVVLSLLHSGQVRLCGNFRDAPLDDFAD